jgi:RHS repeat-associated protein
MRALTELGTPFREGCRRIAYSTPAAVVLVLLAAAFAPRLADAQDLFKWESFEDRVDATKELKSVGAEGFGEIIDLQTGGLGFNFVDMDLQGDSDLAVRVGRSYRVENSRGAPANRVFGDWELEIPRLSGRFSGDWLAGTSTNRCSNASPPSIPSNLVGIFETQDFWQGVRLQIPDVANGELLVPREGVQKPTSGEDFRWYVDGQVFLYCLPTIQNGAGEGFVAVTPDGTKYRFDWMSSRVVPGLSEKLYDAGGTPGGLYSLPVTENALYVTRVEDRFGNYVTYEYSNASDERILPTRITASDGRRIEFTFTYLWGTYTLYKIEGGTPALWGQKRVVYGYQQDSSPAQRPSLAGVYYTEGSEWTIDFRKLSHSPIVYEIGEESGRSCEVPAFPQNGYAPVTTSAPAVISGTITHPGGAKATYTLDLQEHSRSNVVVSCANVTTAPAGAPPGTGNVPTDDNPLFPISWYDWTLTQKTIAGPAVEPMTWAYSYESDLVYQYLPGSSPDFPVCTAGAACYDPPCTDPSCAGTARTTVILPDGSVDLYTFGNSWQYNEGKLLNVEKFDAQGTSMEVVSHTYDLTRSDQNYPSRFGLSLRGGQDGFVSEYHRPKERTETVRDGVTFTWAVTRLIPNEERPLRFDAWARPESVDKFSTLGHTKVDSYTYHDNNSTWVLNQLASFEVDGMEVKSATFDPITALPLTFSAFGQQKQTLTYHSSGSQAGLVHTVTDALNRTTTLDNWKRQVPRAVTHPDGTSESATVDDFGRVTSRTDEMGFTTSYEYDYGDRLKKVIYPPDYPGSHFETRISYSKSGAQYGLPDGHWVSYEVTGNRLREIHYDGLWRPILELKQTSAGTPSNRFTRRTFDYRGLETFASYPAKSSPKYWSLVAGVSTAYDALGRVVQTTQTSELGDLVQTTTYEAPFTTRTVSARGGHTVRRFQAFDVPDYSVPTRLDQPEGVSTLIERDVFGKVRSLQRSGLFSPTWGAPQSLSSLRQLIYDDQQRLCKTIEPDGGVTIYDYDVADQLAWTARGQNSLVSASSCDRQSALVTDRVYHHFDLRGRYSAIDYPADTDDVGFTHFPDGAVQTATTGQLVSISPATWGSKTSEWTYIYNPRRQLQGESLSVDGLVFDLFTDYNSNHDPDEVRYPSGLALNLYPDGYGAPQQAGTFVTAAQYGPDGSPTRWTFGNNVVRRITKNARLLPILIEDKKGTGVRFAHQMSYDEHGNVAQIVDAQLSAWETRSLAYDLKDRLVAVTGAIQGDESYEYDVLDNLRRYVRGSVDQRFMHSTSTGQLERIEDHLGAQLFGYTWNARGELASRSDGVPQTAQFDFDMAGRLVELDGGATKYAYDAHGRRVWTEGSGGLKRYHVYARSGKLMYTHDLGADQRSDYIYFGNTLVAQRVRPLSSEAATVTYLHADYRGTPSVTTNASGTIVDRQLLKAYGEAYDGIAKEGPGFTGHANDIASGLVYMQQRYYDPISARFISVDPIASSAKSFNRYWYADNNPYSLVDPDGRDAVAIGFPNYQIEYRGRKWNNLGHAGVLLINPKSGLTRYYEFGRYDETSGFVRRVPIGNVVMQNGAPTTDSLGAVLAQISQNSGQGGPIQGAYFAGADFQRMEAYASGLAGKTSADGGYGDWSPYNSCGTFVQDTLKKGGIDTPWMVDPRPNSYLGELQGVQGAEGFSFDKGSFKGVFRVEGRLDSKRLDRELNR